MSIAEKNAKILIEALGIEIFCIAPGSRSTPLVLAASKKDCTVHYDERGCGFHALGIGVSTKKAAGVIVTSGTAVGNLMPAVMEAKESGVPMILLTADRPHELQSCSANQTIDQSKLFQSFVVWQEELSLSDPEIGEDYFRSLGAYAAMQSRKGPVHLNLLIREPLNRFEGIPKTPVYSKKPPKISGKGILLIGKTEKDPTPIFALGERLKWPVFTDILARGRKSVLPQNFSSLPKLDHVLHFGTRFVSKNLFLHLQKVRPENYAHIGENTELFDPYRLITAFYKMDEETFCQNVTSQNVLPFSFDYKTEVKNSEEAFMRYLGENFPEKAALFLGNSLTIRHADHFFSPKTPAQIFANRGVSGIDGNIATACGICRSIKRPLIAVLGDQTFLHDLNSLPLSKDLPILFIVINNGGGEIFSRLPIYQRKDVYEKFFQAKHSLNFSPIAKQFQITYSETFSLKKAFDVVQPTILEIQKDVPCFPFCNQATLKTLL